MKKHVTLEIATGDPAGIQAAIYGGADRVELCAGLSEGGITPSIASIRYSSKLIPTYILVRPRSGDFVYSEDEIALMEDDIRESATAGAQGIVVGALTPEGEVDKEACRRLLAAAEGLDTTFHRAFDRAADPFRALEDIIDLGFKRILTSGQASSAYEGRELIAKLKKQAGERIIIMAGAGVNPDNAAETLAESGADEIHASARGAIPSAMKERKSPVLGRAESANGSRQGTVEAKVKAIRKAINA